MWDNHLILKKLANLLLLASVGMLLYAVGFWLTHVLGWRCGWVFEPTEGIRL